MSTFIRYNSGDLVQDNAKINSNTWSTGNNELTSFFTSYTQAISSNYVFLAFVILKFVLKILLI